MLIDHFTWIPQIWVSSFLKITLEAIRELPIVLGGLFAVMEFRVGHRAEAMEH